MSDRECIELLQWALPRLGLRWEGFRRLRGQVCKRLGRRVKELGLGAREYRVLLESDPAEWERFDGFCRITISRFYRDRAVFDCLRDRLLPELCRAALARGETALRCWSAGCASGEEPYTVAILFRLALRERFPGLRLALLATDADEGLLSRADRACYEGGSLRELPAGWVDRAFTREGEEYCLLPELREGIELRCEDLRRRLPPGPFELILCRNVVFTYCDAPLQDRLLPELVERLIPGGALVIGGHEALPGGGAGLERVGSLPIYRRPERPGGGD